MFRKGAKKMCKLRMILVLVALGALCVPPILATDPGTKPSSHQSNYDQNAAEKMVQQIEQSHIDGNVPAAKDFHKFLVRDLQKYFSSLLETKVLVEYELLRDGPTQSGVSFPKYYAYEFESSRCATRHGARNFGSFQSFTIANLSRR